MVHYKIIRDNSTCYSYMPIGLVVELDGDSVHVLVHTLVLELEGLPAVGEAPSSTTQQFSRWCQVL